MLPMWWQKKILRYTLRYVLLRTGLLEEQALDVDNLDISIGRQNIIELKNVGLNISRVSKLAQLPPCLRLETARVLLLRLTIPADFYQSSILVEVDGVEVVVRLEEDSGSNRPTARSQGTQSPAKTRTPQHRKTNRRIHSPPLYDPGGQADSNESLHIPTTQEMAKTFLQDETPQGRRELEASVVANTRGIDESFVSESSDGDELGTGTGIGLPGFVASFLEGILDRFRLDIKNVQIRLETSISTETRQDVPVTIKLRVRAANLGSVEVIQATEQRKLERRRTVGLQDISVVLVSNATVLTDFELASQPSHEEVDSTLLSSHNSEAARSGPSEVGEQVFSAAASQHSSLSARSRSLNHEVESVGPTTSLSLSLSQDRPPASVEASIATMDADRFADSGDEEYEDAQTRSSELDIRAGDDNISWGSRRSHASAPAEDPWKSMVSEDDLPDSLYLKLERASTPRAQSSRGSSPFQTRLRHTISPLDRSRPSPGSWPRIDNSPERRWKEPGPGSWPLMETQHSAIDPLDRVPTIADQITDNKRNALEQTETDEQEFATPPEPLDQINDNMLESKIFSHEDAESMYMSAMTNNPQVAVPGGWNSDVQSRSSPDHTKTPALSKTTRAHKENLLREQQSKAGPASGNATPRARSPVHHFAARNQRPSAPETITELLHIDQLSITIPSPNSSGNKDPATSEATDVVQGLVPAFGIPGSFSAYSEMSNSRIRDATSVYAEDSSSLPTQAQEPPVPSETMSDIVVTLGTVCGQFDISSGRVMYALSNKIVQSLPPTSSESPNADASHVQQPGPCFSIHLQSLELSFQEQSSADTPMQRASDPDRAAVCICCAHVSITVSNDPGLRIASFAILLGGQDFLSFGPDNLFHAAQAPSLETPAISVSVARNRFLANRRPITEVSIQTTPLQVLIDLAKIDETFASFGGLSGILELGNSILTESGASSPTASKSPKGVHFAVESEESNSNPELKVNARVGGVTTALRGSSFSVKLRTTTIKAIHREQGTVATVEHVIISGPHLPDDSLSAPSFVDLATLRIEYMATPQDKDLERLLSLLIPSKDKYDSDDDILIDTLLRQRKKGGLLRVAIGDAMVRIDEWESISSLTDLRNDLTKLSDVTKYLPEDERPGMLTLLRIKAARMQIPVNEQFGKLRLDSQDLHLAHVGIPSLLAFSVGNIMSTQLGNDTDALLHSFVSSTGTENLPVIMARMLGDEEEPTIKIKLYNICAEYNVPIILALANVDEVSALEESVDAMAQSIADLFLAGGPSEIKHTPGSDLSKSATKQTTIDLLIHDCGVGLTPQKVSSKALLTFRDAHVSTKVPSGSLIHARIDLRKASIFVIDYVQMKNSDTSTLLINTSNKIAVADRLLSFLAMQGFVCVASVMSASISFTAKEDPESASKAVEVDVKNELLLLETCADSTQTLLATLGALAPPSPPSNEPKYLTEPMPLEDMIKSFSGEAVIQPDAEIFSQVLFDVDKESEDNISEMAYPESIGGSILNAENEETGDLFAESEMVGSLYGPVSGTFGLQGDDESTLGDDYPETAESLLEEDPFEMTIAPDDRLGDAALLRDLRRQCQRPVSDRSIDLGLYEAEDLGFDALGSGQQALGSKYRFNAPFVSDLRQSRGMKSHKLPFLLRLRDFHVIWHLYDGYDWQRTRDGIAEVVEQIEQKAEERKTRHHRTAQDLDDNESVIGDFLFNSIYIGVPTSLDVQDLRHQINHNIDEDVSETASIPASGMSRPTSYSASGQPRPRQRRRLKLGRSRNHKISFELKGVSADVLTYPSGSGEILNSVDVRIKTFEIFDLVPSSTWRKFLTHMTNDPSAREVSKPMFHVELDTVKTLESHAASEFRIHVTVLPLRLHVDQDALDFIVRFFAFKDNSLLEGEIKESEKPFIQRIEIETVDLCLDYKPKSLDYAGLRSGKTSELMNILTLDTANIQLKHAIQYGIRGFEQLHPILNDMWTEDIVKNQLATVLGGTAAARSLVNLGAGMKDVIAIPIREYKKDGRIVRSIQKGAYHFGKTTTSELARLGAKVALGTQTLLSNAEELLSPGSAIPPGHHSLGRRISGEGWHDVAGNSDGKEPERRAVSAYANQPLGLLAGLKSARKYLEHDLLTARDALIAVQGEFLDSRGPGDMAGAVVRHAPRVILRPVIGATRAVGTTLLGVGNQIDRGNLRKVEDKYKRR